jgi:hypothetical protein
MKLYQQFYIITGFVILNNMSSCEKLIEVELPSNQIASDQVFVDVQTAMLLWLDYIQDYVITRRLRRSVRQIIRALHR